MNGTGAALRHAATEFRAGHSEDVANGPKQRHVGFGINLPVHAIDVDSYHVRFSLLFG